MFHLGKRCAYFGQLLTQSFFLLFYWSSNITIQGWQGQNLRQSCIVCWVLRSKNTIFQIGKLWYRSLHLLNVIKLDFFAFEQNNCIKQHIWDLCKSFIALFISILEHCEPRHNALSKTKVHTNSIDYVNKEFENKWKLTMNLM